jgi:hypothetical protein
MATISIAHLMNHLLLYFTIVVLSIAVVQCTLLFVAFARSLRPLHVCRRQFDNYMTTSFPYVSIIFSNHASPSVVVSAKSKEHIGIPFAFINRATRRL